MHPPAALAIGVLAAAGAQDILAQPAPIAERIFGAWLQVSGLGGCADDSRDEPFGADPTGLIGLTREGRFSLFPSRAEVPRIAPNDRATATAEEAQGVMCTAMVYFCSDAVNETECILTLRTSTFTTLIGSRPGGASSSCSPPKRSGSRTHAPLRG